jgi:hypothetical protein
MSALLYEKASRAAKLACTYMRKTRNLGYVSRHEGVPLPTWYWDVLEQALDTAEELTAMLPDEYFADSVSADYLGLGGGGMFNLSDEPYERAKTVLASIEARRKHVKRKGKIALLANTSGRTPEEAAAFQRKAEELRSRL